MKQPPDIPSLGELAFQYGTIDRNQLDHILGMESKTGLSHTQLMKQENMATEYQISLILLVQDFLILRQEGERFGEIAVEKGFATREDVDKALQKQLQEFRRAKLKLMIGEILVESGVITPEQKEVITRQQKLLEPQDHTPKEDAVENIKPQGPTPRDREYAVTKENQPLKEIKPEDETLLDKEHAVAQNNQPLENLEIHEQTPQDNIPGQEALNLSPEELRFLKIRDLDKIFASNVVETGFATEEHVNRALATQKLEFKRQGSIHLLGDIMVLEGFLTKEQRDLILAVQNRLSTIPDKEVSQNGIEVLLSDDNMEAWIKITNDQNPPLSFTMVTDALNRRGVTHGILSNAIIQCCLDRKMTCFIAAKGDLPEIQGTPGVKYLFDIEPKTPDNNRQEPRVERGEALAELKWVEKTIHGRDVLGKSVEKELPHRRDPSVFNCGKGARIASDKDRTIAGTSGTPFLSILGHLHVFPIINVLDDADLKFGSMEEFSAINVSGILTGAYPVKAGRVKAREIRGCNLVSLGDITVFLGITNAVIKTQGSIRARYIHNSTIEAFGDVIVDHEILDSTITISGCCSAQNSRIIASTISARGGITACGIGSDITEPCHISAGREEHLVTELERIALDIAEIQKEIDRLRNSTTNMGNEIKQLFKRMIGLKRLHDAVRKEKEKIRQELEKEGGKETDREKPNTSQRLKDLDKKLVSALKILNRHNKRKKELEAELIILEKAEATARPLLMAEVQELERKRFALLSWSQKSSGVAEIRVNGKIAQGTFISGQFISTTTKKPYQGVKILEKREPGTPEQFKLALKKL